MKILLPIFLLLAQQAYSQLSGEILVDKRKIETDIPYKITGSKAGKFVFEISVNVDGIVTGCVLLTDKSTIVSTPLMMKAKNQILTGLKFERNYTSPEFHKGIVTITVVKETTTP